MIAVKNHRHGGVTNPKARLRFEITLQQALDAPTVVTPFHVYDCAPQSDGAAALVIAAEDVVDRFTNRPVWIRGVGLGLDSVMHQHKGDMTTFPATVRAAKQAFRMAGLTPADIDVAEVHDFFTGIELISYEDLGFADRFEAYKLVETEVTSVGGALPVNTSGGGLKAKGHPPGATGVAQCVELFAQLRGGGRQSSGRSPSCVGTQCRWPPHSGGRGDSSGRTGFQWRVRARIVGPRGGGNRQERLGADAGCGWAVPDVGRRGEIPVPASVLLAGVPGAGVVCRAGGAGADVVGGHSVHRAGEFHAQHLVARARCGGSVRCRCGFRGGDPGGADGHGVDRGRCGGLPRCVRTWGRAPSGRRSTRWRCWASTRCSVW